MLPESVAGNPPRSIVTDHYLLDQCNRYSGHAGPGAANNKLKAQGRTNLADGISLDVTDDLQG